MIEYDQTKQEQICMANKAKKTYFCYCSVEHMFEKCFVGLALERFLFCCSYFFKRVFVVLVMLLKTYCLVGHTFFLKKTTCFVGHT